ncbi:MAG TPA: hypothetical protein VNR42_04940, partial [Solirubrobacteraceae bacterium]|nr:hypothetical protein [Solirubrobacteraceae bacterium]
MRVQLSPKGVQGRKTPELVSAVGLSRSKRQLQRRAEQFAGQLQRGVIGIGHRVPPVGVRAAAKSGSSAPIAFAFGKASR